MSRIGIPPSSILRIVAPFALLTLGLTLALGCAESALDPSEAVAFFEQYADAVSSFDPRLASLYADEAKIMVVTRSIGGGYRRREFEGADYKAAIPDLLSLARGDGALVGFKDVSYSEEDGGIRIRGIRSATTEREGAPFSLLVRRDASGEWRIYSERLVIMPKPR